MKSIELRQFGEPESSIHLIEVDDPQPPKVGQVTLIVDAFPINPADILFIQGLYATRPRLPCALGAECVGTISAVGEGVTDLAIGDRVINMGNPNWMQAITVSRKAVIKMPNDYDPLQLAMLKVNPPTAMLMLKNYIDLQKGDWVIQNAANSAVGKCVIRLAKDMGVKTVNIVRRQDVVDELLEMGADLVVLDNSSLTEQIKEGVGDGKIRLGIDAVGGEICQTMANCMVENSTLVNYGLLSGENCQMGPNNLVFKNISLQGFWLLLHLQKMSPVEIQKLYTGLAEKVNSGVLHSVIDSVYSIEDIDKAVSHAAQGGRSGKILVTPNGTVG